MTNSNLHLSYDESRRLKALSSEDFNKLDSSEKEEYRLLKNKQKSLQGMRKKHENSKASPLSWLQFSIFIPGITMILGIIAALMIISGNILGWIIIGGWWLIYISLGEKVSKK